MRYFKSSKKYFASLLGAAFTAGMIGMLFFVPMLHNGPGYTLYLPGYCGKLLFRLFGLKVVIFHYGIAAVRSIIFSVLIALVIFILLHVYMQRSYRKRVLSKLTRDCDPVMFLTANQPYIDAGNDWFFRRKERKGIFDFDIVAFQAIALMESDRLDEAEEYLQHMMQSRHLRYKAFANYKLLNYLYYLWKSGEAGNMVRFQEYLDCIRLLNQHSSARRSMEAFFPGYSKFCKAMEHYYCGRYEAAYAIVQSYNKKLVPLHRLYVLLFQAILEHRLGLNEAYQRNFQAAETISKDCFCVKRVKQTIH